MTAPARRVGEPLDVGVLAGKFTETSYEPDPDTPYDAWVDIVATFGRMVRSCQFWIGDAILFGARKYGETYSQAEAVTGLNPETLSNIVSVCERVGLPRRRGNLSFSHHAAVAYLDEHDADLLLDRAEREGWSVARLREAKRQLRAGEPVTREPRQLDLGEESASRATGVEATAAVEAERAGCTKHTPVCGYCGEPLTGWHAPEGPR